eukprot:9068214-Heterocapsa_arctica.AAC.1
MYTAGASDESYGSRIGIKKFAHADVIMDNNACVNVDALLDHLLAYVKSTAMSALIPPPKAPRQSWVSSRAQSLMCQAAPPRRGMHTVRVLHTKALMRMTVLALRPHAHRLIYFVGDE